MSLSEVWRLIHQSRTSGVSFEKIAELRKDDPHGGIKAGSVWHWQKKLLSMYRNLSKLSFVGASRISVVTDASNTQLQDYLVTCFFETRLGMGAMVLHSTSGLLRCFSQGSKTLRRKRSG